MLRRDDEFVFHSFGRDGNKSFYFRYDDLYGKKTETYIETITFPDSLPELAPLHSSILFNLHLMLGISYWKLHCSRTIRIETGSLTREQALFWNTVYTKGLGEFFYRNNIDFRNLVIFPFDLDKKAPAKLSMRLKKGNRNRAERSLVFIGGGKDSIVTIEQMKKSGKEFIGFILDTNDNSSFVQEVARHADITFVVIKRKVDSILLSKNKNHYYGHVPFSAILSWLGYFYASLYGYEYVVASNEKSSNEGNVEYHGLVVNHQWSKSFEYEKLFQLYARSYLSLDITYFSLLRSLNEFQISGIFASYERYDAIITSCNRNFTLNGKNKKSRWCGECSKCVFTFLMFAVFMKKERLLRMFGKNLLNDKKLLPIYKELLGMSKHKPFDCVGTATECKTAFLLLKKRDSYRNDYIVHNLIVS